MGGTSTALCARSRYISPLSSPLYPSPLPYLQLSQNVAFYTATSAAAAELLTLLTLAASAIKSMRDEPPLPTIQIHEKKNSNHLSSGWRPTRPKTWVQ